VKNEKNEMDREALNMNAETYIYLSKSLEKVGYDAQNQKIMQFPVDTLFYYKNEGIYVFELIK